MKPAKKSRSTKVKEDEESSQDTLAHPIEDTNDGEDTNEAVEQPKKTKRGKVAGKSTRTSSRAKAPQDGDEGVVEAAKKPSEKRRAPTKAKASTGKTSKASTPSGKAGKPKTKSAKQAATSTTPKKRKSTKKSAEHARDEVVDGKRCFSIVLGSIEPEVDEELLPPGGGKYKGSNPMQAGKKAFGAICRRCAEKDSNSEFKFCIRETTPGSKESTFTYIGTKTKLSEPNIVQKKDKSYAVNFETHVRAFKVPKPVVAKSSKRKSTKKGKSQADEADIQDPTVTSGGDEEGENSGEKGDDTKNGEDVSGDEAEEGESSEDAEEGESAAKEDGDEEDTGSEEEN